MFEQTFVEGTGKTNKPWTVALSFGIQMLMIGLLVLVPLIWTEVLPKGTLTSFLVAPPPPPPPPPPPAASAPVKVAKVIPRQFDAGRLMAPKSIPKEIAMIREEELPPAMSGGVGVVGGVPGGVPGGTSGGVLGGIIGSVPTAAPPPPPPPPVKEWRSRRKCSASASAAMCSRRSWLSSRNLFTPRWRSRQEFREQCGLRQLSAATAPFRT